MARVSQAFTFLRVEQDFKRLRSAYTKTLGIVHAQFRDGLENGIIFNLLGNGPYTHCMANLVHRFNHGMVDRVTHQILDITAVDLRKVHRKILQTEKKGASFNGTYLSPNCR